MQIEKFTLTERELREAVLGYFIDAFELDDARIDPDVNNWRILFGEDNNAIIFDRNPS